MTAEYLRWLNAQPQVARAAARVMEAKRIPAEAQVRQAAVYDAVRLVFADGGDLHGPALDRVADLHGVTSDWVRHLCALARGDVRKGNDLMKAPTGAQLLAEVRAFRARQAELERSAAPVVLPLLESQTRHRRRAGVSD